MTCIFCYRSSSEVELTAEHVFPEALGGQLVVRSVCKGCNDQLGSHVDSGLTEDFLVRMLRLGLRIPNKSGVVPSPLHDGTIKDHPDRKGTYFQPNREGHGEVKLRPLVERTTSPDGRSIIKVVAEPHEAEEILAKLRERAAGKGQELRLVETWQETIRKPTVVKQTQAQPTSLLRPLLKIAYELGVLWLGPAYATHVCGLPLARAVVTGLVADIEAELGYFPPRSVFTIWPIPSPYHAGCLQLVDGKVWTALRVFNVIEARVLLADTQEDFPGVEPQWVILDPVAGTVTHGLGIAPAPLAADDDTGIVWDQVEANRYRVSVVYRGQQTTTTELELTIAKSV